MLTIISFCCEFEDGIASGDTSIRFDLNLDTIGSTWAEIDEFIGSGASCCDEDGWLITDRQQDTVDETR